MIVSVCARCMLRNKDSYQQQLVIDELRSGLTVGVQLQEVRCMAACDKPISVGISDLGKASYLFGGITSKEHVLAVVEFVGQYQKSKNGWTNSKERPKALRSKTVARIPVSFLQIAKDSASK